jgi:hypothetical protein
VDPDPLLPLEVEPLDPDPLLPLEEVEALPLELDTDRPVVPLALEALLLAVAEVPLEPAAVVLVEPLLVEPLLVAPLLVELLLHPLNTATQAARIIARFMGLPPRGSATRTEEGAGLARSPHPGGRAAS